jgi:hypothetical protein
MNYLEYYNNHKKYIHYVVFLIAYTFLTFCFIQNTSSFTDYSNIINFTLLSLWFLIILKFTFINETLFRGENVNVSQEMKRSVYLLFILGGFFLLLGLFSYLLVHYTSFLGNLTLFLVTIIGLYMFQKTLVRLLKNLYMQSDLSAFQNGMSFGVLFFIIELTLILLYFIYPILKRKWYASQGKILLNNPVPLDKKKQLATFHDLHENDGYDYQYSLSMWFFFHERPPNKNINYQKFTEIFSYGNKPQILYNNKTQTLQIVMQQGKEKNEIVYEGVMKLQKWNHVVVTYDKGRCDIFINGKLISTKKNIVPYMSYDTLSVGKENGLDSGVSNVVYYDSKLMGQEIYELYQTLKNNPVM